MIVVVDGPSGVGKTSTCRGVAERLGWNYLDTGAMYRAIACAFVNAKVDPEDKAEIIRITQTAQLEISLVATNQWIRINGQDVTKQIREPEISAIVSRVSTLPECRAELVARQRDLIFSNAQPGIIAEGRDLTTVVAPDADLRILLTADPEVRVARRKAELGDKVTADQVIDQVIRRDRDDSTLVNFTTAADGVLTLDSTDLDLAQVVGVICDLVEGKND